MVRHPQDASPTTPPWRQPAQQAIGYQKEIKKTLGMTSKTHAYLKFEMTAYVRCQIDL